VGITAVSPQTLRKAQDVLLGSPELSAADDVDNAQPCLFVHLNHRLPNAGRKA